MWSQMYPVTLISSGYNYTAPSRCSPHMAYAQVFRASAVAQAVSSTQNTLSPSSPFGQIPSQSQLSHHIVLVFSVPRFLAQQAESSYNCFFVYYMWLYLSVESINLLCELI